MGVHEMLFGFHAYSLMHLWVVIALIVTCLTVIRRGKATDDPRHFDRQFAIALVGIWTILLLNDLRPSRINWDRSLPLNWCDLVTLLGAAALLTNVRLARSLLYYWGLALSSQVFIVPVLRDGPMRPDFWFYWIGHGVIVVAAVYDVVVRGYRPTRRDWRQTLACTIAYAMVIVPIDIFLHANYGYLGNTDISQRSIITVFGPWPTRLPVLMMVAFTMMAGMTLPWVMRREKKDQRSFSMPSSHPSPPLPIAA